MTHKTRLALALILFLMLGAILLILLNPGGKTGKQLDIYSGLPVAGNINFPDVSSDGKVRFFTGSAVAELNLDDYSSRSITREFSLPKARSFLWRGNKALVEFEKIEEYNDIVPKGMVYRSTTWWLFDIASQSFSPLLDARGQIIDATWKDDNSYYAVSQISSDNRQGIGEYKIGTNKPAETYPDTSNTTLVGNSSKGLIVHHLNQVLITRSDGSETLPFSSGRIPYISADGNSVVYEELVNDRTVFGRELTVKRGRLVKYDLETGKSVELVSDNSGNYAFSGQTLVMLPPSGNSASNVNTKVKTGLVIDINRDIRLNLNINEEGLLQTGTLTAMASVKSSENEFTGILVNHVKSLIALSSDKAIAEKKGSFPLIPFNKSIIKTKSAEMTYRVSTNTLEILIRSKNASRQDVVNEIRALGADPNQINKVWLEHVESPLN